MTHRTARCPVCRVRVGPCLDSSDRPIAQYHTARVLAEAVGAVDHGAEAVRLRELARAKR